MKKLYIRCFKYKDGIIPVKSYGLVCEPLIDTIFKDVFIKSYSKHIANWMEKYPDGKVDFVWLW